MQELNLDFASDASDDDTPAYRPDVITAVRERLNALVDVEERTFTGPPIAGLPLQPLELGELLVDLSVEHDYSSARGQFIDALWASCRDADVQAALVGDAAMRAFASILLGGYATAVDFLRMLVGEPSPQVLAEVRRIVGPSDAVPGCMPTKTSERATASPGLIALARLAGPQELAAAMTAALALHDGSPIRQAEVEVFPRLSTAALLVFEKAGDWYSPAVGSYKEDPTGALVNEPAYLEFARSAFELADERLEALHDGRLPYESDKAFTIEEGQALARAARVAARHDAPWLRALIGRVLPRVSVAPTAAKSMPSQSVSIALGYAVLTDPTPEGVQALRETLSVIRHAGVEKKLARNLKPAERGLAARPDVALRMLVGTKADKKQQAFVATCLEATWWTGGDWPLAQWRTELVGTPNGAPFAVGQLWRVTWGDGPTRVLRVEAIKTGGARFVDLQGCAIEEAEDARVALWHPLQSAPDERALWQRTVADLRQRAPLRQAFREVYEPGADELGALQTMEFDGYVLRLRALVGLARREGWTLAAGDAGLTRCFGGLRVFFRVRAELYPGIAGNAPSGEVWFDSWRDGRWERLTLGAVPPVIYSEACRAVDLLVSVSGFAIDKLDDFGVQTVGDMGVRRRSRLYALGQHPLGAMAEMRRRALALALAQHIAEGRLTVEARHVRVGDATVHLATGRVIERGAAVELEPPSAKVMLAAVPWLPYDEVLLQRIVDNVAALLARTVT